MWTFHVLTVLCAKVGVFDAGSTGTRLTVYDFCENSQLASIQKRASCVIDKAKGSEIERCLKELLDATETSTSIPLAFHGTAGLRELPKERCKEVIKVVKSALSEYNLVEVSVLSGLQEAEYTQKAYEYLEPESRDVLIVDLGGKSVQVINKKRDYGSTLKTFPLGITDSNCNITQPIPKARERCALLPIKFRQLKPLDITKNQQVVLLSAFYDIFQDFDPEITLESIESYYNHRCLKKTLIRCKDLRFAIKLLKFIGIPKDKEITAQRYARGVDITWALGKALELERKANTLQKQNIDDTLQK